MALKGRSLTSRLNISSKILPFPFSKKAISLKGLYRQAGKSWKQLNQKLCLRNREQNCHSKCLFLPLKPLFCLASFSFLGLQVFLLVQNRGGWEEWSGV